MRFQPIARVIATVAFPTIALAQGSLEPPPGDPAPTQKSLQEIWDRIDDVASRTDVLQTRVEAQQQIITQQSALIDILAAALDASPAWYIHPVESTVHPFLNLGGSFASTPNGQPAFAYPYSSDYTLRYAEFTGTRWNFSDVVDHQTGPTSLAFAASGHPAIAYHDQTDNKLMFAEFDGDSWQITTIDSGEGTGIFPSLAFSPEGIPGIAYYDQVAGELKYAQSDGTVWQIFTVDSEGDFGSFRSLRWTHDGHPAIAYTETTNDLLKYAEYDGTTWHIAEVMQGREPVHISLAFAPTGEPRIAYSASPEFEIELARLEGTSWRLEPVFQPPSGFALYTSLAIHPSRRLAISFFATDSKSLHYMLFDGSSWQDAIVAKFGTVSTINNFTGLVFSPSGQPMIGFFDEAEETITLATRGAPLHP